MTSTPEPAPSRRDDPRMHTAEMAAVRVTEVVTTDTLGSGPMRPPLPTRQVALLVAAGGGLGAALRLLVALVLPTVTTPTLVEVPWATLWVNVVGCLGLGALIGALEVVPGRPWMRPLLGTGVCGGFTTMSAVVLEGSAMIGADFPIPAFGYAVTTVVACLAAVLGGFLAGRRLARRHVARRADGTAGQDAERDHPTGRDRAERRGGPAGPEGDR